MSLKQQDVVKAFQQIIHKKNDTIHELTERTNQLTVRNRLLQQRIDKLSNIKSGLSQRDATNALASLMSRNTFAYGKIILNKHTITATINQRYATIVYSFDFVNADQYYGSQELSFELTIHSEAFVSNFTA
eukprot:193832_1